MEPRITIVAAIDEKIYRDMGTCIRTQDGEWFSNWAGECIELRGYKLIARVTDEVGANAVIYSDFMRGSALETNYALAMIEGLPDIRVKALATVNAAEWEAFRHVHYAQINEGEGSVIETLIQTTGYQIIQELTFGVFPSSCMVRYRDGEGERHYAFVKIEEVPTPYTGKTLAGAYLYAVQAASALELFITHLPGERKVWEPPMSFGHLTLDAAMMRAHLMEWFVWAEREVAERGDLDGSKRLRGL